MSRATLWVGYALIALVMYVAMVTLTDVNVAAGLVAITIGVLTGALVMVIISLVLLMRR